MEEKKLMKEQEKLRKLEFHSYKLSGETEFRNSTINRRSNRCHAMGINTRQCSTPVIDSFRACGKLLDVGGVTKTLDFNVVVLDRDFLNS
ncbi:hypothetical protein K1719_040826 [Acacia pycnantha]|nr:hypothetical protein K1719_040826 [Acacia pycnantha]